MVELKLPRGKSFSNRLTISVLTFIVIVVLSALYFFVVNQAPDNSIVTSDQKPSSDLAALMIATLDAKEAPALLLKGYYVKLGDHDYKVYQKNGRVFTHQDDRDQRLQAGDVVYKDGKAYLVGKDGQLHPLKEGDLTHIKGKPYVWHNGKWVAENALPNGASPGDFVIKGGHLYRVGADGKLHPFNGKLKAGDIVWKQGKAYIVGKEGQLHPLKNGQIVTINGKPYEWKNGHLVPLSKIGVRPGDLVYKDGQYYQMGADGKLHLYHGALKPGQTVYKDGKIYRVGPNGQLQLVKDGTLVTEGGKAYTIENGQLVLRQEPCEIFHQNGKTYIINKDGRYKPFLKGDKCTAPNGKTIMLEHNKIVVFSQKPKASKSLWTVDMSKTSRQAMAAPIAIIHGDSDLNTKNIPQIGGLAKAQNSLNVADVANSYAMQNGQSAKIAFMRRAKTQTSGLLNSRVQQNHSAYALTPGAIIPATLETGIDSDLPGTIVAQVSQNVYDSRKGKSLLIPQGTKVIGHYDSQVTYGQNRVLMVWQRLEFPNGNSFDLQGMPGVDLAGFSGLHDTVDNHYFKIFGSALLFSLFGAASQMSQPNNTGNGGPSNQQIIYSAVGQQMTQVSSKQIEKNMGIQPTIKIRPGDNFNILVTRAMVFDGPYRFDRGL